MGNTDSSTTTTTTSGSVNVCFADYEGVFNMQQNTFANSMFLDIRSESEYNESHIDQAHHLKFAHKLSLTKNKASREYELYKKWLKQIVKLHQSTYCKSKIRFYIVHNNDDEMSLISNVCAWLNDLYYDKMDDIPQIDTEQYYYINFDAYKCKYPFMCSDNQYYEEGRLFPSQITNQIYLCNWGIASDGFIYKILNEIKYVINATCDHPNIYNIKSDQTCIYSQQFLTDVGKSMVINNQSQKMTVNCAMENPMFKRQNEKIMELRNEFADIRLNYMRIPIVDNPSNNVFKYFQQCIEFIELAHNNNSRILIHCRHGQSRSATITAAYLIYKQNLTVQESLQFIKNKRPRINPNDGFINQLNEWYKICQNNNNNQNINQKHEQQQQQQQQTENKNENENEEKNAMNINININSQLNKSKEIQIEQMNANNEMFEMESKINILKSKKEEKKSAADCSYYLYPSTNKSEAQKYNPQPIDSNRIREITNKMGDKTIINGSSKWNNGATTETFDYTNWMEKRLSQMLLNEISFNDSNIKINEIINMTVYATILLIKKQYKFGYDISFECKWSGKISDNIREKCQGILKMDDIANDESIDQWQYEISIHE